MNLATGTFTSTEIDLNFPSPGFSWTIARANSRNRPNSSGEFRVAITDTSQGINWYQLSQPTLSMNFVGDMVTIQYQSDGFFQFTQADIASTVYLGMDKAKGVVRFDESIGERPSQASFDTSTRAAPSSHFLILATLARPTLVENSGTSRTPPGTRRR